MKSLSPEPETAGEIWEDNDMANTSYLIYVAPRKKPELRGPYRYDIDLLENPPFEDDKKGPWAFRCNHRGMPVPASPQWERGEEKLYRITLEGLVELLDAVDKFRNSSDGYYSTPEKR